MGELRKARVDFVESLEQNGIKAVHYNEENIIPPVAIVLPDELYITFPQNVQKMRQTNVGIAIVVISSRGTGNAQADELDDMIEKVHAIINPYCQIESVSSPARMKVQNKEHLGAVFQIQHQITLEGE